MINRMFCFLIVLICFVLGSVVDGSAADTGQQAKLRRVGYFKDSNRNRIYTISIKAGTTEKEVRSYAKRLTHTQGRIMAAYFYIEGGAIPGDDVTLAKNVFHVNEILYEQPGLSKWRYAFMRYLTGKTEFVDCQQESENALCRIN